ITLFFEHGKVHFKVAKGAQPEQQFIDQLKQHKEAIAAFLSKGSEHFKTINPTLEKIQPYSKPAHIPLSYAQERLWFLDKLKGSTNYHIPLVWRVSGELNLDALEQAFQQIINHHAILRTVYYEAEGKPFQKVLARDTWRMQRTYQEELIGVDVAAFINEEVYRAFDLKTDHTLRVHTIIDSDEAYTVIVVFHHIAFDGWSVPLFLDNLQAYYRAEVEGRPAALPDCPIQYTDYALWQREPATLSGFEEKLQYWEDTLRDITPSALPTDYPRTQAPTTHGKAYVHALDAGLKERLAELCKAQGVTMFTALLSAFKVLLYKYTGSADICVGSPVANRTQTEIEPLIGFFVNTVVFRSKLAPELSYQALLAQVRETVIATQQYQDVPFEKIVERVVKERDATRNPLFDVMFTLDRANGSEGFSLGKATFSNADFINEIAKFDLVCTLTEKPDGLDLSMVYSLALFSEGTIKQLVAHFESLLKALLAEPLVEIGQLTMLSEAEQEKLLHTFNATRAFYEREASLVDLFERQVAAR
ncbi:MAG TPA: condensation domain-containing protein, partial [Hymenobacter sp.]|nr:condensation domain-containing protein [Hymenobacter sp.]